MIIGRTCLLSFIGALVLLHCTFLFIYRRHISNEYNVIKSTTPVVIIKLPRSGSSWFTSLLNQLENVYLAKEIVQRKDKRKNQQPSVVLSHLIKALAEPSSKIAFSSTSKYFSGRYWEDYILKGKSQKSLQIVGFTLNPEHIDPSMLTLSILNSYLSILTYLYVLQILIGTNF